MLTIAMRYWLLFVSLSSFVFASPKPKDDFLICETCKASVDTAYFYIESKTSNLTDFYELLSDLCGATLKPVCLGAIQEMGPVVLTNVLGKYLDGEFLCGRVLGQCEYNNTSDDLETWAQNVLADKPNLPVPRVNSTSRITFGHVTDLHFDLDYEVGAATQCGLPLCCRGEYPGTGSAGFYGDYNCDIPYVTLASGIKALADLKPDFLLWTGDNPPHNVWDQSQSFQLQYINEADTLLKHYFQPGVTTVYPALGNHGCFPVNIFKFGDEAWLTDATAEMWYPWLDDQAYYTIKEFGGYSVLHGDTNLRIISVNTQACNNLNFWFIQNVTDPGNQVEWLQGELAAAEANGEVVYIIGHIPIGDFDCLSQWGYRYKVLVDRYEHIIRGQFFGHTHNDQIKVNRGFFSQLPTSVQWVAPSLTSYTDLNPSFRVFEADADTFLLTNYFQYRLNLTQANANMTLEAPWELAYDFLSEYDLPDMSVQTVYAWAEGLITDEESMVKYLVNKQSGGPGSPTECPAVCRANNICDLTNGVPQDIWTCQDEDPDALNYVLQLLYGPWEYPSS